MNSKVIKAAWVTSLPVLVGYVIMGFGFGIMLLNAGYGVGWALLMSVTIYAGTLQYVGVSLLAAPASLIMTLLTTLMINGRHLFYSLSMIGKYSGSGKLKPYLAFALTDETYALLSAEYDIAEEDRHAFYFWVSLFNQSYWIIGGVLGNLAGAALPFDTSGVGFSMTALFVAAFTEQFLSSQERVSAILGLTITLVSRYLWGRELFLIPAMLILTVTLLALRKYLEPQEVVDHA